MLLPSALPCDHAQIPGAKSSRPLLQRFMPYNNNSVARTSALPTVSTVSVIALPSPVEEPMNAIGFPFPSPLLSPSTITSGLQSTCRALQAFLGVTPSTIPITSKRNKIPLPPTDHKSPLQALPIHDNRISKRHPSPKKPATPPRGRNKRTREVYEAEDQENTMQIDLHGAPESASIARDHGYGYSHHHNYNYNYDSGYPDSSPSEGDIESAGLYNETKMFSTPKRRRRLPGPVDLPFGLDRQDFADLQDGSPSTFSTPQSVRRTITMQDDSSMITLPCTPAPVARRSATLDDSGHDNEDDASEDWWTPLDDAQLVTLVLEKMKLSRRDWEDCAKVLGAEGEGKSLGKRWKWLMEEGKVGMKRGLDEGGRFEGRRASKRQGRADVRSLF